MNIPEVNIKLPKINVHRKKLRWGVAGLGRFSESAVIPALKANLKAEVKSVYSHSSERAKSIAGKFAVEQYYNDFEKFLDSDIEAVYIGSANNYHYQQVLNAAKAGKHILCDKPLSITSSEAKEMVDVCKRNYVQLAVNYTQRFHPAAVKVKELLDKGYIGKIISISVNYNASYPPDDNFRFKKVLSGGGALRDIGTHSIDLLRYFGGEINFIQGLYDNVIYQSEVDDYAAGIATFEKGGHGIFCVSFNTTRSFNRVEILGHSGAISIENLYGNKSTHAKITILHENETKKVFKKRGNKLSNLIKIVQASFIANKVPPITGEDGYQNILLMEALEKKWDEKK